MSTEEHLKKIGEENDIGAHRYILSFLKYIKDNDKQFRTLLVDSAESDFRSRFMQQSILQFVENLNIAFIKDAEQYIYSYILNGSTGIILQWIRSDYAADENMVCELLLPLIKVRLIVLGVSVWLFFTFGCDRIRKSSVI